MKYLIYPHPETLRPLPFYFALEEYVARHYPAEDCFMAWRVPPTVMLGRNQLVAAEVDRAYCEAHGVAVYRRKSGGGCIYADPGVIQFSYISTSSQVNEAFARYMQRMANILRGLGIEATLSGRNDILVEGRKVSGCAFYGIGQRCVLHNSMLYDTRLDHLAHALTPSQAKLSSKGVASARQRVTNVGRYTGLTIAEFMDHVRREMCGTEELRLTEADMEEVSRLEREIGSPDFVYGRDPRCTTVMTHRFAEVGTLEAHVELSHNRIQHIDLTGDYFLLGDIDHDLLQPLQGVEFTREAVARRLDTIDLGAVVRHLTAARLLRLLFGRPPHVKKPEWLKIGLTSRRHTGETSDILRRHHLNTICTSGLCPNRAECWAARTATLMIGGEVCTRRCRFCNTPTGRPAPLDPTEPRHVAETVRALGLRYAVITSVDRDDLPDLGAAHWVSTIEAVRTLCPETRIELLIPDFMGRPELIDRVVATRPHVCGHNMETVRRLTPSVRSVARYDRSLDVLRLISRAGVEAKTGLMLGLGETPAEILETLDDILATGCRRLTLGQYLQPTAAHLPVSAYISPDDFARYRQIALDKGFAHVESGPLVRSSYHAARSDD